MLGSIAVILGAIIIKLTAWKIVDPILAVLIGLWVLPRTGTLLREAGNVLMMGVPAASSSKTCAAHSLPILA